MRPLLMAWFARPPPLNGWAMRRPCLQNWHPIPRTSPASARPLATARLARPDRRGQPDSADDFASRTGQRGGARTARLDSFRRRRRRAPRARGRAAGPRGPRQRVGPLLRRLAVLPQGPPGSSASSRAKRGRTGPEPRQGAQSDRRVPRQHGSTRPGAAGICGLARAPTPANRGPTPTWRRSNFKQATRIARAATLPRR